MGLFNPSGKELCIFATLIVNYLQLTSTAKQVCPYQNFLYKEYFTTPGTWKLLQNSQLLQDNDQLPPNATVCETWNALEYVNGQWRQRSNDTCSAKYCTLATTRTECQNGIPKFTYWRTESSNCWCDTTGSHPATLENIHSSYEICKKGYRNGKYEELTNTDYQACGRQVTCSDISSHSGPGCYCKSGFRLDPSSGGCTNSSQCSTPVLESMLKLYVPSSLICNGPSPEKDAVISWITINNDMTLYNYSIASQDTVIASGSIRGPSTVSDERNVYRVQGNGGQLTLPAEICTIEGDYSIEVTVEFNEEVILTVQDAELSNLDLRLAHELPLSSPSVMNGALEVYYKSNTAWYLMCVPHQWSEEATRVVCRQLGAAGNGSIALSATSVYANMDTVPRWGMTVYSVAVRCSGTELRLADCASLRFRSAPCNPEMIPQIKCANDKRDIL